MQFVMQSLLRVLLGFFTKSRLSHKSAYFVSVATSERLKMKFAPKTLNLVAYGKTKI